MSRNKIAESLDMRTEAELESKSDTLPEVVEEVQSTEIVEHDGNNEMEDHVQQNLNDLELARSNIQNIINTGDESLKDMVDLAKQSESARAFEVASTLMKTLLDANREYVDVSTKKKEAIEKTKQNNPADNTTNVTNNNLIFSTADLLKTLKGEDSGKE